MQTAADDSDALLVRVWLSVDGTPCARLMHVERTEGALPTRETCAGADNIRTAFARWLEGWTARAEHRSCS